MINPAILLPLLSCVLGIASLFVEPKDIKNPQGKSIAFFLFSIMLLLICGVAIWEIIDTDQQLTRKTIVSTKLRDALNSTQNDRTREQPVPTPEEKTSIIVFSTDPDLTIDKPASAEWEVQIAKPFNREIIVMKRNELFSTAIVYANQQEAENYLTKVRDELNRQSAFVTSLEQFCPDRNEVQPPERTIQEKYTFYVCNNSR